MSFVDCGDDITMKIPDCKDITQSLVMVSHQNCS